MNDLEYQTIGEVEQDHWWFRHRLSKVKNVLQKESEKKKYSLNIFDIGCGTGGLLFELKKNNFISKASGCEPHPIGFEFCLHDWHTTLYEAAVGEHTLEVTSISPFTNIY